MTLDIPWLNIIPKWAIYGKNVYISGSDGIGEELIARSSSSRNERTTIIAADSSTGDSKRALSLASSSRSTTKLYMSLVRDIRRVGILEDVRIALGVGSSISSGSVTMLIVDTDSSGVSGSQILSIGDKINSDSENISLSSSSLDTSVGVYGCIILFQFFLL